MNKKNICWFLILFISLYVTNTFSATVTREFEKTYPFKSGELVVQNVNGKIEVETWDKEEVQVYANIQVKARSYDLAEKFMEEVDILVRHSSDEIVIEPDYPKLKEGDSFFDWIIGAHKPQVTVDFVIKTPDKVDVDLKSVNGSVEVENIKGRAKLRSVNGGLNAYDMGGPVDASTTNGGIMVEIDELKISDNMSFHTVNGGIKVYLPEDIAADIKISTVNGGIHTDFPLTIKGQWGPKNVSGELNGGGELIKLNTVNGGVSLYKR